MTPNDIVVGKRYTNMYYPGSVYLGIGMRKLFTTSGEYTEKHLVCIESGHPNRIGLMVQEGENVDPAFWDGFQDESSSSQIFIVYANA